MGTLGARLRSQDNALNFVRLVLAAAVIFAHAWPLSGTDGGLTWSDTGAGQIAVGGFFCLSGYLIAGSRVRLSFGAYLWRRALRIFPAFWACLIVVAFGFAPLSAFLTGENWVPGNSISFVTSNASLYIQQWTIDSTLTDAPNGSWNGSLWTLLYEFAAYLCLGAIFSIKAARAPAVVAALFLSVTALQYLAPGPMKVTTNLYLHGLTLAGFFLAGVLLWSLRDRLPVRADLALLAGGMTVALTSIGQFVELAPLPFAYVLLWFGATSKVRIGMKNDISYGVYIYAFPMAQLLWSVGVVEAIDPWTFALLTLALTVPLAWASWLVIERPAMCLKSVVANRQSEHVLVA